MKLIEQYATLAEENEALLILDVQLETLTVPGEIEVLRDFLERPYVHLAIDIEYSVDPRQVPGVDLGPWTARRSPTPSRSWTS